MMEKREYISPNMELTHFELANEIVTSSSLDQDADNDDSWELLY